MASKYSVLSGRNLARASDLDVYNFALRYAQAHAMGTPTGVVGAGAAAGPTTFARPARLELGLQSSAATASPRRKRLIESLGHRTTEASRKRVAERILAGYGITL